MTKSITITLGEGDLTDIRNALNSEARRFEDLIQTRAGTVPTQTLDVWTWYAKRLRSLTIALSGAQREAA